MSLTRNEWIEMWASLKIIEKSQKEMRHTFTYLNIPPTMKYRLNENIKGNMIQIQKMKNQIESIIGQME